MGNILEVENLYKHYDGFDLRHINFVLPRGTIMGFIGENGAGKTTTIKLILNQIKRDMGVVKVFGLDSAEYDTGIKEYLGVVMGEGFFSPSFSAREVRGVLRCAYQNWDDKLFTEYLERFELPERKKIKEYSRGMRMKLNIASALSHRPRLLLLDEPTSGLDPVVRGEILDVFLDFIQDETHGILFSSHITSDLERVADYITYLRRGRLMLCEQKDALLRRCAMARFPAARLPELAEAKLTGLRQSSVGCEALVQNRMEFACEYPDIQLDNASIEDIMRFTAEGEGKE